MNNSCRSSGQCAGAAGVLHHPGTQERGQSTWGSRARAAHGQEGKILFFLQRQSVPFISTAVLTGVPVYTGPASAGTLSESESASSVAPSAAV